MKLHRDCGLYLTADAEEINRERSHVYLQRGVVTDMQLSITGDVSLQSASYVLDDRKIGVLLPTGLEIVLLDIVFRRGLQSTQFPTGGPFRGDKAAGLCGQPLTSVKYCHLPFNVLRHTLRKSGAAFPQGGQVS
jgi:hypothetical protein